VDTLNHLVIFTRYPKPGHTKTRLIPHLDEADAAQLQKEMTEYTIGQARKADVQIEICYTGGTLEEMQHWLGTDFVYTDQGDGNLGERMRDTFEEHFALGAERVVIIGSDCPANGWKNIRQSFQSLQQNDCVIGPAGDGGYYLIGLRKPSPQLFDGIDWGGDQVFKQTVKAASGLMVHLLPRLHDVDLPEDIPPKISVIIPTLNEEENLPTALQKIREGFCVETIVVDGGSSDGTKTVFPDALELECRAGRAAQQNLGAVSATGEILLFLHADTELPYHWDWIIRDTLADHSVALGAFAFKVRESFPARKFIEDTTNWRSIKAKLPYGDQGLFMRRETFEQAGGFPEMPIMEDYAFVRSVRKLGDVVTVSEPAITSGRRWKQHGVLKVTLVNKLMIAGYHLGIPPARLATFYRRA